MVTSNEAEPPAGTVTDVVGTPPWVNSTLLSPRKFENVYEPSVEIASVNDRS
jgi:hypothetical protein